MLNELLPFRALWGSPAHLETDLTLGHFFLLLSWISLRLLKQLASGNSKVLGESQAARIITLCPALSLPTLPSATPGPHRPQPAPPRPGNLPGSAGLPGATSPPPLRVPRGEGGRCLFPAFPPHTTSARTHAHAHPPQTLLSQAAPHSSTVIPLVPGGLRSKTPSGCLKAQTVPNAIILGLS